MLLHLVGVIDQCTVSETNSGFKVLQWLPMILSHWVIWQIIQYTRSFYSSYKCSILPHKFSYQIYRYKIVFRHIELYYANVMCMCSCYMLFMLQESSSLKKLHHLAFQIFHWKIQERVSCEPIMWILTYEVERKNSLWTHHVNTDVWSGEKEFLVNPSGEYWRVKWRERIPCEPIMWILTYEVERKNSLWTHHVKADLWSGEKEFLVNPSCEYWRVEWRERIPCEPIMWIPTYEVEWKNSHEPVM